MLQFIDFNHGAPLLPYKKCLWVSNLFTLLLLQTTKFDRIAAHSQFEALFQTTELTLVAIHSIDRTCLTSRTVIVHNGWLASSEKSLQGDKNWTSYWAKTRLKQCVAWMCLLLQVWRVVAMMLWRRRRCGFQRQKRSAAKEILSNLANAIIIYRFWYTQDEHIQNIEGRICGVWNNAKSDTVDQKPRIFFFFEKLKILRDSVTMRVREHGV